MVMVFFTKVLRTGAKLQILLINHQDCRKILPFGEEISLAHMAHNGTNKSGSD